MKKNILVLALLMLIGNQAFSQKQIGGKKNRQAMSNSIHNFKVTDIAGEDFDLKSLAGKKVIIVNTASECGFTPQYAELEKLYKKYENSLVIIGFPSNDFGKQEPGSDKEIATFCQKNYGVTFPMMSKITVTGNEMHPLYKFLTDKAKNGLEDSTVQWNFQKYLIDEKGNLVKMLPSKVSPLDGSIITWIESGKI